MQIPAKLLAGLRENLRTGFKFGGGGVNSIIISGNGYQAETKSDAGGRFFFSGVPPGSYIVSVECDVELKDIGLCRSTGSPKLL